MEIFMVHHEAPSRKGEAGFTVEPHSREAASVALVLLIFRSRLLRWSQRIPFDGNAGCSGDYFP